MKCDFPRWALAAVWAGRIVAIASALATPAALRGGLVLDVPSLSKAFSPTVIAAGGETVLTFTLTSAAGVPAVGNVGFVDTLPSSLVVANPPVVGGTCANAAAATTATAGGSTVTVANLQVSAGPTSCTVTVNVTNLEGALNASCGGNPAGFTNTSANVSVRGAANDVQASCLAVVEPTLSKAFLPTTIADGGISVLTFTLANAAGNPATSSVGFTDTLPSGLVVANATVGGTCVNAAAATSLVAGGSSISVGHLQVPAGGGSGSACTVTVNITNASGQTNASCDLNPTGFTNFAANVESLNVTRSFEPACLVVNTSTPPPSVAIVPALSSVMLGLLAAALGVAGLFLARRLSS